MKAITNENYTAGTNTRHSVKQWLNKSYGPDVMFNATAVRARAGILNLILGGTIFLLLAKPEMDPVLYVAPFLLFDMIMGIIFGLTPCCPTGVIGTFLSKKIKPVPTPHKPKRFAWSLGASLAITCLALRLFDVHEAWLLGTFGTFFILTWLDAVLGFCVGCWIYSKVFGCQVCRIG